MESQIFFDLVLTAATSFSLVGLLALAVVALPWRDEELKEVETALLEAASPARSMRIPVERTARRAA